MAKKPTIHLIGHGHIDPVWGWRWMEGCEEVRATFRSALQLMEEFPEMKLTATSAAFYAWVEDIDPDLFDQIRSAVDSGRIEIAGGWWIEPDCNLPHGESFVRQGLYGQRWFRSRFGKQAVVGFNPDSFGHTGSIPQILSKQGMDFYCYQRPNAGDKEMVYPDKNGTVFHWESKDGSSVLTANIPYSYNTFTPTVEEDLLAKATWPFLFPGQADLLGFYGVGNHGGGPTRAQIQALLALREKVKAYRFEFSNLERFFAGLSRQADLFPSIDHDLQFHAIGCYSVVSPLKRLNRAAEHQLMRSERLAVWESSLNGSDCLPAKFESLWRDLLFNHFHDILAGSSVESAYTDSRNSLGRVLHESLVIEDRARQRIAKRIHTSAPGRSLIVFNSLPWARKEWVVASEDRFFEFQPEPRPDRPLELKDASGAVVPHTPCRGFWPGQKARGFLAEVPPLGYQLFTIREAPRSRKPEAAGSPMVAEPNLLENSFWRLRFDASEGSLLELFDKSAGLNVVRRGGRFVVLADSSDTWSHGIRAYRSEIGAFNQAMFWVDEHSPVHATIRVRSTYNKSILDQWFTVYADSPTIDVRVRIDWRETFACLKAEFQTGLIDSAATSETAYGFEQRATDAYREYPCQSWLDLSGSLVDGEGKRRAYGLGLASDGFFAFDAQGGTLRPTILRSPPYRHHEPDPFKISDGWNFTDQGIHEFRYRLVPHTGDWREAGLPRTAWELNEPLYLHQESSHKGDLPGQLSFLSVEPGNVVISALKPSEDHPGRWVVRVVETQGVKTRGSMTFAGIEKPKSVTLAPCEILSLLVDPGTGRIQKVDCLEDRM